LRRGRCWLWRNGLPGGFRFRQIPGVQVLKAGVPPGQAGPGFGGKPFKGPGVKAVSKAKEDDLLLPGGTQAQAVVFREGKGGGNIRG
jgi:hypothetical protein